MPMSVTLITDSFGAMQADNLLFDHIIVHDPAGTNISTNKRAFRLNHDTKLEVVEWKNLTRADVYDLSPYDQTLLLDCDYLMFTDNLIDLFWTDTEFTCYRDVLDLTGTGAFSSDRRLGTYSVPMLWATAIYFTKCHFSKAVFDMMKVIKANYSYYAKVYGFSTSPYRNDFSLSIAHHALSGYGSSALLPYKMPTLPSTSVVTQFKPESGQMLYQYKTDKLYTGRIQSTDVHVMNKQAFTDDFNSRVISYAKNK